MAWWRERSLALGARYVLLSEGKLLLQEELFLSLQVVACSGYFCRAIKEGPDSPCYKAL